MSNSQKVPKIFSSVQQSETISIYLSGAIGMPEEYIEELQALREATENDTINIYINSGGGSVATALQIVNNIISCKATVVGCIEAECHSAASYIFLACDTWIVNPNSLMMIHNYSGGHFGKGNDLVQGVQETHKWILSIMRDIYIPFLSENELLSVETKDMYLTSEEISNRLETLMEHRLFEEDLMREEQINKVKEQFEGLMGAENQ
jgi:ATP-dependent protease ClpP protease subunit|tara:strand:+ start:424 stop:1044 length:621 start_codon:yes stop_codon:yes gene_type:complete